MLVLPWYFPKKTWGKSKSDGGQVYLLRIQIIETGARHVLREAHGGEAFCDGGFDNVFQLVLGVTGAELPGMGVHRESHLEYAICWSWSWSLQDAMEASRATLAQKASSDCLETKQNKD